MPNVSKYTSCIQNSRHRFCKLKESVHVFSREKESVVSFFFFFYIKWLSLHQKDLRDELLIFSKWKIDNVRGLIFVWYRLTNGMNDTAWSEPRLIDNKKGCKPDHNVKGKSWDIKCLYRMFLALKECKHLHPLKQ